MPQQLTELRDRWYNSLRAGNRSERTISHYDDSMKELFRFLETQSLPPTLASLTTELCERYTTWLIETPLTKPWRNSTERSIHGVAGCLRDLSAFLNYLRKTDQLKRKIDVPNPKLPEQEFAVFSEEELAKMFAAPHLASNGPQAIRNRAIVAVLLDTGIRLGELVGITAQDIDWSDREITVTGKGRRTRRVVYAEDAERFLREWNRVRGRTEEVFFCLSYDGIRMMLRRVQKECGVHIHPHRFRHSAASALVRRGMDTAKVKKLMGHRSITTTLRYVHQDVRDLHDDHADASPLSSVRHLMPDNVVPKPRKRPLTI